MRGDLWNRKVNNGICGGIPHNGGNGIPFDRQTVVVNGFPVDHDRCIGTSPLTRVKRMIHFANEIVKNRD
jgi:hypothetical protein